MVNKDGCESITDGFVHQLGCNSGVDTTANSSQDSTSRPNKLSYPGNLLVYKIAHGPLLRNAADTNGKVL